MFRALRGWVGNRLAALTRGVVRDELAKHRLDRRDSQLLQTLMYQHYRVLVREEKPLPSIFEVGFRVFSQTDEDGLLLFIFAVIGWGGKTFVDIGSSDGITSNCANLALNFGWWGLFVDADEAAIERGREFYSHHMSTLLHPPIFTRAEIRRENINQVIRNAGFEGEVDLLSIDIDGNDYWVWASLECIRPRVVIIETHVEFGHKPIVVPYDPDYRYPGIQPQYHGASPAAMKKLAAEKGYRLVGANRYGFNTIYVREEEAGDLLPEISVADVLEHPRNVERGQLFDAIRHMDYFEV